MLGFRFGFNAQSFGFKVQDLGFRKITQNRGLRLLYPAGLLNIGLHGSMCIPFSPGHMQTFKHLWNHIPEPQLHTRKEELELVATRLEENLAPGTLLSR